MDLEQRRCYDCV